VKKPVMLGGGIWKLKRQCRSPPAGNANQITPFITQKQSRASRYILSICNLVYKPIKILPNKFICFLDHHSTPHLSMKVSILCRKLWPFSGHTAQQNPGQGGARGPHPKTTRQTPISCFNWWLKANIMISICIILYD